MLCVARQKYIVKEIIFTIKTIIWSFVQVQHSDWIMRLQDKIVFINIMAKYKQLFTSHESTHEYVLLSLRKWKIHFCLEFT